MKRHPSEARKRMLLGLGNRHAGPHAKSKKVLRRDRRIKDRRGDWDSQSGHLMVTLPEIPDAAQTGHR